MNQDDINRKRVPESFTGELVQMQPRLSVIQMQTRISTKRTNRVHSVALCTTPLTTRNKCTFQVTQCNLGRSTLRSQESVEYLELCVKLYHVR